MSVPNSGGLERRWTHHVYLPLSGLAKSALGRPVAKYGAGSTQLKSLTRLLELAGLRVGEARFFDLVLAPPPLDRMLAGSTPRSPSAGSAPARPAAPRTRRSDNGERHRLAAVNGRVAVVTNIPRPYRRALFDTLRTQLATSGLDLRVCYTSDPSKHVRRGATQAGVYDPQTEEFVPGLSLRLGYERVVTVPTGMAKALGQHQPLCVVSGGFGPSSLAVRVGVVAPVCRMCFGLERGREVSPWSAG